MALIICQNVSLGYDGKKVVKDLSLEIKAGEYLCIVGENGSGKSTLMKSLLGLKAPMEGKIILSEGLKRNEIGYLPQQSNVQKDFPASVYEIVLSGCLNKKGILPFYTKKEKQTARNNMQLLHIEALKNHCYRELSGGQQQRVLLARALCATKKMLLLDEPVSGLDLAVTLELYEVLREINEKLGIAIVMVSHDIPSAVKNASRILHLKENVLFLGSTKEYLASEVSKIFLGGENNVSTII